MDTRRRLRLAAGAGCAAMAGAVTGWLISLDVDWSATASRRECAQFTGICVGIAPVIGLALGLLGTVLGCGAGLAAAGARPLLVTVPAAVVTVYAAIVIFGRLYPGGRLHPALVFSLMIALALALLALAFTGLKAMAG